MHAVNDCKLQSPCWALAGQGLDAGVSCSGCCMEQDLQGHFCRLVCDCVMPLPQEACCRVSVLIADLPQFADLFPSALLFAGKKTC